MSGVQLSVGCVWGQAHQDLGVTEEQGLCVYVVSRNLEHLAVEKTPC